MSLMFSTKCHFLEIEMVGSSEMTMTLSSIESLNLTLIL